MWYALAARICGDQSLLSADNRPLDSDDGAPQPVHGPLLPSGRPERSASESTSDASSSGPSEDANHVSPAAHHDDHPDDDDASLTWSETSLHLVGPCLAQTKELVYTQYRLEIMARAAASGYELTTRSLAAQVGASRRRLADSGSPAAGQKDGRSTSSRLPMNSVLADGLAAEAAPGTSPCPCPCPCPGLLRILEPWTPYKPCIAQ